MDATGTNTQDAARRLQTRTAALVIVQTSPECLSYRLVDSAGRVLWSNRVYDCPEGDAGARGGWRRGQHSMGIA